MEITQALEKNVILGNTPFDDSQKKMIFNIMKAQVVRSRVTMTGVFLSALQANEEHPSKEVEELLDRFIIKNIRQTDVLLSTGQFERCLLLSHTGEAEGKAFLTRLLSAFKKKNLQIPILSFFASMAEINNREVTYDEFVQAGKQGLLESKSSHEIETIHLFKKREIETIKVSVLESDRILSNVLCASLRNLSFPYFEMEIMQFNDGYEFLESEFIISGHTHVVITDDILPRTNGLKVVHSLREMPNQKKFTIFMMTKRQSEEDMLYAYQAGVDQYLIKPFNIRLFEAQMKRTFERFWS